MSCRLKRLHRNRAKCIKLVNVFSSSFHPEFRYANKEYSACWFSPWPFVPRSSAYAKPIPGNYSPLRLDCFQRLSNPNVACVSPKRQVSNICSPFGWAESPQNILLFAKKDVQFFLLLLLRQFMLRCCCRWVFLSSRFCSFGCRVDAASTIFTYWVSFRRFDHRRFINWVVYISYYYLNWNSRAFALFLRRAAKFRFFFFFFFFCVFFFVPLRLLALLWLCFPLSLLKNAPNFRYRIQISE